MDVSSNIDQPSDDTAEQTITVIGFGRRLIATLTDGILLAAFTFIVAFAIGFVGIFIQMFNPYEPLPLSQLIIVCGVILSVIYYVGYWSKSGQTIGNTLFGIKVVSKDGSSLSGGKALLRYFGYIVSAIVLSLGFLWAAFDRKRQGVSRRLQVLGFPASTQPTTYPSSCFFLASYSSSVMRPWSRSSASFASSASAEVSSVPEAAWGAG